MLVLSRRVGDSIVIAGDITVTLLAIHGGSIRLGIDAPVNTQLEFPELAGIDNAEAVTPSDAQELADWIRWEGNHND